jgi:hypothetical protein
MRYLIPFVFFSFFLAGCGKPAFYPPYVSECVQAQKTREQAKTLSGQDKALLEAKADALEETCRDAMRRKQESEDAKHDLPVR